MAAVALLASIGVPTPPEHLTTWEIRDRAEHALHEGPLPLRVVARHEVDRALAAMDLSADAAAGLREEVLHARQRLA